MHGPVQIESAIALSVLTADDADEYVALVLENEERLMRWLPYYGRVNSAKRFQGYLESIRIVTKLRLWVDFIIRIHGELAGSVQIHNIDPLNRLGNVGYWLGERYTGHGTMSRVLPAIAEIAFRDYNIHRLQLLTAVDNIASRTAAEQAGFAYETTLRDHFTRPGGYSDAAVYVKFGDYS
jgi:ribosomal-protein-serine acetyltransferase